MKLLILGATGGTGLEVVRRGIERGHSITAFVRSPERLKSFGNQINIRHGDLLNPAELENALHGHDAVVSAFGPRLPVSKADAHLLEQFALALTKSMSHNGTTRLVIESVAFLFRDSILPPTYLLGRLLFPGIVADSSAMERLVRESKLDWTIVRPPELTNKPPRGKYRVREGHLPHFGFRISRADLADFMIKAAEDGSSIHKTFGVAN
ncbi:MAG TPA: SDR family oxidoreductase [Terriglobales bacterium]|nr:SDR family oxidoreductase [Terriglobales bacterium]